MFSKINQSIFRNLFNKNRSNLRTFSYLRSNFLSSNLNQSNNLLLPYISSSKSTDHLNLFGSIFLLFFGINLINDQNKKNKIFCEDNNVKYYTYEEVMKHQSIEDGIWVTYNNNVYDITNFIENHPGGSKKILLASGGPLEPFWNIYQMHTDGSAKDILKHYKIGEIDPNSKNKKKIGNNNIHDPYQNEPIRFPLLKINSKKPFNGEPTRELLAESFITPNEVFYVRNHLPVPLVNPKTYQLDIIRESTNSTASFSLNDLKTKFPKVEITATIQCAGNRRDQMSQYKTVRGLGWKGGAIGTANWGGVRLIDVLKYVGIDINDLNMIEDLDEKHVQFIGLDRDDENIYGASIPIINALNPLNDVILAYEMNGEPLPRDHGFPVRVIVPGTVGARNVKWLSQIKISKKESDSHWQQRDYKGFGPYVDWDKDNLDYDNATSIQELPVQSAICVPNNGDTFHVDEDDEIELKGYAWSGGGKGIVRVDVSIDGGKTWLPANLIPPSNNDGKLQNMRKSWAWTQWELTIPLTDEIRKLKKLKLCCKAVDVAYNTQPEKFDSIWNVRGVLSTAWDKLEINIV